MEKNIKANSNGRSKASSQDSKPVKRKDFLTFEDSLLLYNDIKVKRKQSDYPFWDAVAFTTTNEEQKFSVERQIDEQLANKDLPVSLPYIVVCDPPGTKIGSGGANFLALQELYHLLGDRLYTMKVLLIHTGGQSRRLPSHSVLGKLFAIAPMGETVKRLLDLKMAMYQPFISRMKPGVFVTASDDIETYQLDISSENWSFSNDGFTALAHPSSIDVGMTHGVYVLPNDSKKSGKTTWCSPCLRVLQKPSYQLMQEAGAICDGDKGANSDPSEFVYSDSAYFFSHSVSKKLLSALDTINPYKCETDAYGDFLQPLGENSSKSYINPKTSSSALVKVQKSLYDLLHEIPLTVLVLKKSKFYHLGTMEEYVHNITENSNFISETGSQKKSFSAIVSMQVKTRKYESASKTINGTTMFSVLTKNSVLGKSAILECCDFETAIEFHRGVISNCQLKPSSKNETLQIPTNTLWHTASVFVNERIKYVTVVFNLQDDLKETKNFNECHALKMLGRDLKTVCTLLSIPSTETLFPPELAKVSIWDCKMFPIRSTREASFLASHSMVKRVLSVPKSNNELNRSWLVTPRMSMADILENKDINEMINYQQTLKIKINNLKAEPSQC